MSNYFYINILYNYFHMSTQVSVGGKLGNNSLCFYLHSPNNKMLNILHIPTGYSFSVYIEVCFGFLLNFFVV